MIDCLIKIEIHNMHTDCVNHIFNPTAILRTNQFLFQYNQIFPLNILNGSDFTQLRCSLDSTPSPWNFSKSKPYSHAADTDDHEQGKVCSGSSLGQGCERERGLMVQQKKRRKKQSQMGITRVDQEGPDWANSTCVSLGQPQSISQCLLLNSVASKEKPNTSPAHSI